MASDAEDYCSDCDSLHGIENDEEGDCSFPSSSQVRVFRLLLDSKLETPCFFFFCILLGTILRSLGFLFHSHSLFYAKSDFFTMNGFASFLPQFIFFQSGDRWLEMLNWRAEAVLRSLRRERKKWVFVMFMRTVRLVIGDDSTCRKQCDFCGDSLEGKKIKNWSFWMWKVGFFFHNFSWIIEWVAGFRLISNL